MVTFPASTCQQPFTVSRIADNMVSTRYTTAATVLPHVKPQRKHQWPDDRLAWPADQLACTHVCECPSSPRPAMVHVVGIVRDSAEVEGHANYCEQRSGQEQCNE